MGQLTLAIVCSSISLSAILCAGHVNDAELEQISDELPERDCFRLLLSLKQSNWEINQTQFSQVYAAYVRCTDCNILSIGNNLN